MKLLPDDDPDTGKRLNVEGYRVTQRALAKIRKAGLPRPTKQQQSNGEPLNPILDLNLASISNVQLGKIMAEFVAMCEYSAYAASIADIDRTVALNIYEFVEAKVRLGKSGTVKNRDDKTKTDPRVIEARTEFLERDAVSRLTRTIAENYHRSYTAISREISRRQLEADVS